jgi:dTDP-4-amino-4,6-dideoxyglucose
MLPHTERLVERVLSLPSGTAVGPAEISLICGLIRTVVAQGCTIRERIEYTEREAVAAELVPAAA